MEKKVTVFYKNKDVGRGRKDIIFFIYGYRCSYCLEKFPVSKLTRDHIIPRSEGGKNTWQNYTPACPECNTKKGVTMLREERLIYLRKKAEKFYERFLAENLLMLKKDGKTYVYSNPYRPYTEPSQRQEG